MAKFEEGEIGRGDQKPISLVVLQGVIKKSQNTPKLAERKNASKVQVMLSQENLVPYGTSIIRPDDGFAKPAQESPNSEPVGLRLGSEI